MAVSKNCLTYVLSHSWIILCILLINSTPVVSVQKHRKLCKDSDIQIMSSRGARIEPYERSRVELELGKPLKYKYQDRLILSFEFKTLSANGTLFYGRSKSNPNEIIALLLRDGHLVYMVQCPSVHADVRLPTKESRPLNDNRWHTVYYQVKFGRDGKKGHVEVDGLKHRKGYEVNCETLTSIVMGGHMPNVADHRYHPVVSLNHRYEDGELTFTWSEQSRWLMDKHGHFEGCIRKVYSSYFLASPPRYYAVSQCD